MEFGLKINKGMISEVFLGDCMDYMAQFPDKFFELAIVDPPYGINAPNMQMGQNLTRNNGHKQSQSTAVKNRLQRLNGGGGKLKNRILNTSKIEWDNKRPTQVYFDELIRVSQNQIIWGGNYFDLPPTRGFIVWNKNQPWENFSQAEFAWTSFDCPSKVFTYSNRGGSNEETKIHPTQKDVCLYKYCLDRMAKPNDKILDTHLGSQSSRIAAYDLGFDFYGSELDEDYFKSGCDRFEKHKLIKEEIKEKGFASTELSKNNPILF